MKELTQKEAKQKSLAMDVAWEIVLGCDRLDRTDLRAIVDQEGFDVEEMKKQTRYYIENNYHGSSDDFVEEQLAYWYEPWK